MRVAPLLAPLGGNDVPRGMGEVVMERCCATEEVGRKVAEPPVEGLQRLLERY